MTAEAIKELSIAQLDKQKVDLQKLIKERRDLYERIGTGEVSPFSSDIEAIKVGRVSENVKQTIDRREGKFMEFERQSLEIQAASFISERDERLERLAEIREYVDRGHLANEVLIHYEDQFASFCASVMGIKDLPGVIEELDSKKKDREPDNNLIEAYNKLGEFVLGLRDRRYPQKEWARSWDADTNELEEESLYLLFPRDLLKDSSLITRTLHALNRSEYVGNENFLTKSQLILITDEELLSIRNIGERGLNLIHLMKTVIKAERRIQE